MQQTKGYRTFVIGDIHGAYRALQQCLLRSGFNYDTDHLICLGDVCDGWPETKSCVDEFQKMKKVTYILGNHDFWTLEWMKTGVVNGVWFDQGGDATIRSYEEVPATHVRFLASAHEYYTVDNKLFVHAGIIPGVPVQYQTTQTFLWDRTLAGIALTGYERGVTANVTEYSEIYIGHTPIPFKKPVRGCEIWLMDTGAGWSGVLSMMNIETKEIFTSDPVPSLYPGVQGRTKGGR